MLGEGQVQADVGAAGQGPQSLGMAPPMARHGHAGCCGDPTACEKLLYPAADTVRERIIVCADDERARFPPTNRVHTVRAALPAVIKPMVHIAALVRSKPHDKLLQLQPLRS
jgi:hypothetical protein